MKKFIKIGGFGCEKGSICKSDSCRRKVVVSSNGHVSIENIFTCRITQDQVTKLGEIMNRIPKRV